MITYFKDQKFVENISEKNYYACFIIEISFCWRKLGTWRHRVLSILLLLRHWRDAREKIRDRRGIGMLIPRREESRARFCGRFSPGDIAARHEMHRRVHLHFVHAQWRGAASTPVLLSLSQTNGALLDNWLHTDVTKRAPRRMPNICGLVVVSKTRRPMLLIYCLSRGILSRRLLLLLRARNEMSIVVMEKRGLVHGVTIATSVRSDTQDFTRVFFRATRALVIAKAELNWN